MWHKDWSQRKTIVLLGWGIINNDRIENLGDKKYLIFSYVCLIGRMEKWIDGKKKICLVKKKNEMMIENVICINLFSLKKINSLIFF